MFDQTARGGDEHSSANPGSSATNPVAQDMIGNVHVADARPSA